MVNSMTGFAAATGAHDGYQWAWELRSVNTKGLDMRLRVPDWIAGLEQALRRAVQGQVKRGNITLNLRLTRDSEGEAPAIDMAALRQTLAALAVIEDQAADAGLSLQNATAADILNQRGVLQAGPVQDASSDLLKVLLADFTPLIDAFNAMRASEGAALLTILQDNLAQLEGLVTAAAHEAELRRDDMAATLRQNLARILDNTDGADPDRVAQELALIAVKTDVTEEIDRLGAHIEAARALMATDGPIGRKFDFLMQEFNREANTLCSKSQSTALTRVGLDLKAAIDQMREQVQNVE